MATITLRPTTTGRYILTAVSLAITTLAQLAFAQSSPVRDGADGAALVINSAAAPVRQDTTPNGFEVFPVTSDTMYSVWSDAPTDADGATNAAGTTAGTVAEKLIYDNPLGKFAVTFFAGQRVADDLTLSVKSGCPMTRYRFQIIGKANPTACGGPGMTCGPLRVDFALYDECPEAGGVEIAGTIGCASTAVGDTTPQGEPCIFLPDADALTEINFIPIVPVALPSRVWLATTMSRADASVVMGTPALAGFSADVIDTFSFPCNSRIGGFPIGAYASFNASVYGDATCGDAHLTYQNMLASDVGINAGTNVCIAEDFTLNRTCNMSEMEVAIRGIGRYDFEIRQPTANGEPEGFCNALFAFGGPAAIPHTRFAFVNQGGLKVFRRTFDPPIPLPTKDLFAVFMGNNSNATWVVTRHNATIGSTEGTFYTFSGNQDAGTWSLTQAPGGVTAGFHLTITCDGPAPVGACCDMFILDEAGDSVCRDVPEINCSSSFAGPGFQPGWVEGMACADEPFSHACGQAACCTPDDTCENLTNNECNALPPIEDTRQWTRGEYCESLSEPCLPHACLQDGNGDCLTSHNTLGCQDIFCCVDVCMADRWCCETEWDLVCVREAEAACNLFVSNGGDCAPPTSQASDAVATKGTGVITGESNDAEPALSGLSGGSVPGTSPQAKNPAATFGHLEQPDDPQMARPLTPPPGVVAGRTVVERDGFVSVQVNVDQFGNNIPGDAANEPSIAVNPTSPNEIVIGWRQFDTIQSNFRQAGVGYSHDSGATWTFPGVLTPGFFRSDPVVVADADGYFHYLSLGVDSGCDYNCDLFSSIDGGVTWGDPVFAFGGDKAWITVDTTGGPGRNNLYQTWTERTACEPGTSFSRSTDRGNSFGATASGTPNWGTLTVDVNGYLYACGANLGVQRSTNAWDTTAQPIFDRIATVNLGGGVVFRRSGTPNPGGLLGQVWITSDRSDVPSAGDLYVLASVLGPSTDLLDVVFTRSEDGGFTWSDPVTVNDDTIGNGTYQWFGTMDVAPNGRIDAIWNDTRNTGQVNLSELYYTFSTDGGRTWSKNIPVSPVFDSWIGWPNQDKIGDYYDMVSENSGVNIAYAATFNGEQDVYYLHIPSNDCNENGLPDNIDIIEGRSQDCNGDGLPDECGADCDGNGLPDICEIINGAADCDGDKLLDICQTDFDGDGLIDACDSDRDNDGVPNASDICPRTLPGRPTLPDGRPRLDTTGDCEIDLRDFWRFWNCFTGGLSGLEPPLDACLERFDTNDDTLLDLRDAAVFQNAFTGAAP